MINLEHIHIFACGVWVGMLILSIGLVLAEEHYTMQFGDLLIRKISEGKKTVTRRLAQHGDYMPPTGLHKEVRSWQGSLKLREGEVYAICPGRGKTQVGKFHLLDIRKERLHDITEEEARLEGFADRDEFRLYWNSLYNKHDENWQANPEVYRLAFEVVTLPRQDEQGYWIPLPKK